MVIISGSLYIPSIPLLVGGGPTQCMGDIKRVGVCRFNCAGLCSPYCISLVLERFGVWCLGKIPAGERGDLTFYSRPETNMKPNKHLPYKDPCPGKKEFRV